MLEDKFSWIPVYPAATVAPVLGGPTGPVEITAKPQEDKFPWIPPYAPPVASPPPEPTPPPVNQGSPVIAGIKELARRAATEFPQTQPVQARFIAPRVTPGTVAEFPSMAKDVWEATQATVRGVPAFAAGLVGQTVSAAGQVWKKYLEKGPLGLTGLDVVRALGLPEAVAAGQEVAEQLSYQPQTEGGAKLAHAITLPFEALDVGWQKLVNVTTKDPVLRESLMFMGRAGMFYAIPRATNYIKSVLARGERPSLLKITSLIDAEKTSLSDAARPDFEAIKKGIEDRIGMPIENAVQNAAYQTRLEQMLETSLRQPEEVQTWPEMFTSGRDVLRKIPRGEEPTPAPGVPPTVVPMSPAELAKWEVKKLGTATPAFRDETTGTVYPGQLGEQTHPQMLVRLEDQGVNLDKLTAGWIKDTGEFATSAEVQAQRTPPPAAVPKAKALPKHVFGAMPIPGRPGEPTFMEKMYAGKDRAAEAAHLGIPAPKKARRPLTKAEEFEAKTEFYAAENERMEQSKARARAGDPEGLKEVADDLLRGTGFDAESIGEFKKNAFMDGEEAKKIAQKYITGEISYEGASSRLKDMVQDTVTEPTPGESFGLVNPEPSPPPFKPEASYKPDLAAGERQAQGTLPMPEAAPLFAREASAKAKRPEPTKMAEPDEFEAWYKSQMEDLDKSIKAAPPGQVKAFKLYMKDPTGTERVIGNFPEEARAKLQEYAKKKGVEGKLVFGDTFNAKADRVTGMKELGIAKDAMTGLKENWGQLDAVASELAKEIPEDTPPIGLSIKQVEGATPTKSFRFTDPEIESRFQGAKGVRPESNIAKIGTFVTHIKDMATRTYEFLPARAEYVEAKQALKNLEKQRAVSYDRTLRVLHGVTVGQDSAAHDLFTRKVILDDLMNEAKAGREIPFGFNKENLTNELGRLDAEVGTSPVVQSSLAKRQRVWDALKSDYLKSAEDIGLDVENRLTKEDYYRHMVLDYAESKGVRAAGKKLKTPAGRGFLKERGGTQLDINTDYLQAETEVMSQMLYDMEQMRAIKKIKDAYDIGDKVRAKAKTDGLKDWHDAIPEGQVAWQPREGNMLFTAYSIPERMAKALMDGEGIDIEKLAGKVREVTAIGKKRSEWVIKEDLAKTLDNLTQKRPPSPITEVVKGLQRSWKVWTLISPRRVIKYNVRNLTGDADAAFVGNPGGFAKVPRAVKELYDFIIIKKPMTAEMTEWFKRGGMESTLQAQELGDIRSLSVFKNLYEGAKKAKEIPAQAWKKYWGAARLTTDFREAILRYANFLDYREQIKGNPEGQPKNFGASLREEIMALKDPADRAFRLSNELLGSYDEISVIGQRLREYIYPFWSWKELNFKRYVRMTKNAWLDGNTAKMLGKSFAVRTPVHAYRFGKFLVKATGFWAMLQAWNNTQYPDIEAELPENVRDAPHVILGRDKDGKPQYFTRIGALGDFLEWFGLDAAPNMVSSWLSGKKSLKEISNAMIEAPVNQIVNGLSPYYKVPTELLMGKTLFPNAFSPRAIRDRGTYIAQQLGLKNEYDALVGRPTRGYGKSLSELFLYKSDPEEAAFSEVYNMKLGFLKKLGKSGGESTITPKSNALYWTKIAHRYGDRVAEKKYLGEYVSYSYMEGEMVGKGDTQIRAGIRSALITSLKNLHPLGGLGHAERETFLKSLDEEGKETLARAIRFYNSVILGNLNLMSKDLSEILGDRK